MTLTIVTRSKKQQFINWERQSKGSLKVEVDFHLSIFIIKVWDLFTIHIQNKKFTV